MYMYRHIKKHLETNKMRTSLNHGFRYGYPCENQLITTTHDLFQNHDKCIHIDLAILDFSKAFDTVPHDKLLYKLEKKYGITGKVHIWLAHFLTNGICQYNL